MRYGSLGRLLDDLRGMAGGNVLIERSALGRDTLARANAAFAARADGDGRTIERFEIVFVTGWAPSPDLDAGRRQPTQHGSSALPRPGARAG